MRISARSLVIAGAALWVLVTACAGGEANRQEDSGPAASSADDDTGGPGAKGADGVAVAPDGTATADGMPVADGSVPGSGDARVDPGPPDGDTGGDPGRNDAGAPDVAATGDGGAGPTDTGAQPEVDTPAPPADVAGPGTDAASPDAVADATPDAGPAKEPDVWTPPVLPAGLIGKPVADFPPLAEFKSAIASDGSPRGPQDLLGSATVMWFYPAASTSG